MVPIPFEGFPFATAWPNNTSSRTDCGCWVVPPRRWDLAPHALQLDYGWRCGLLRRRDAVRLCYLKALDGEAVPRRSFRICADALSSCFWIPLPGLMRISISRSARANRALRHQYIGLRTHKGPVFRHSNARSLNSSAFRLLPKPRLCGATIQVLDIEALLHREVRCERWV